jgi:hypothetical protein
MFDVHSCILVVYLWGIIFQGGGLFGKDELFCSTPFRNVSIGFVAICIVEVISCDPLMVLVEYIIFCSTWVWM